MRRLLAAVAFILFAAILPPDHLRQGYGGPPKLYAEAEGGSHVSATQAPAGPLSTRPAEQLGLKLESKRASVDVLVIDRVEKPSAN